MRKLLIFSTIWLLGAVACTTNNDAERSDIYIISTNDIHANINLMPQLATLVAEYDRLGDVLLIDSGDRITGNAFVDDAPQPGMPMVELMNSIGYDVVTLGNHEFDFGLENMARLFSMATFPVVCANYDFTGTVCEGVVKEYAVIERGDKRIGVFGLSPDPVGLVAKEYYEGIDFISPVEAANNAVAALEKEKCDVIVCLSHLGWRIGNEYNDERLASETAGIDIILGGHSHDYFEQPLVYKNRDGKDVVMQQMGKNGRHLGIVTLTFE